MQLQLFYNQFRPGQIAWVQGFDPKKVGDTAIQVGSWGDDRRRYPLLPNHVESIVGVEFDAAENVSRILTIVADGERVRYGDFMKEHEAALLANMERWVVGELKDLTAGDLKVMIDYWKGLDGKLYDKNAIMIIGAHEIPLLGWALGPLVDIFLRQEKVKYICSESTEEGIAEIGVQGGPKFHTKKNKNEIPTPKNLFVNLCDAGELKIKADSVLMTYV
jgi:hypothetical protein